MGLPFIFSLAFWNSCIILGSVMSGLFFYIYIVELWLLNSVIQLLGLPTHIPVLGALGAWKWCCISIVAVSLFLSV